MTQKARPVVTESMPALRRDSATIRVHEWTVEVAAGPDKGARHKTLESLVRIGAEGLNDLVLTDPTVSRRHAEIERTVRGFVVRDLGSRNGVFLDGHQVLQAFVQPGDKLLVGKTRLTVKQEAHPTELEVTEEMRFGELFGTSEAMRAAFALLRRVAREDLNLLIEGETGTGKELAARAVHQQSGRRHGPFGVVDCTRLEEAEVAPAFEAARGGTVFLDEVGELHPTLQPKLLRLLEGSDLDVRVVASTARNLDEEVRHDRFRKDLYFRLAVARVRLPPLRARREELGALAAHLVQHLGTQVELSPQTLSLFEGYDWPGNVRELRNVLERGALMQDTGAAQWLDFLARPGEGNPGPGIRTRQVSEVVTSLPYHQAKDRVQGDFERLYFAEVMRRANFDIKLAEEMTGLSMQSLYRLLKKNGLRLKELKNAEGLDT
jgi:two-component system response regulator GlrR